MSKRRSLVEIAKSTQRPVRGPQCYLCMHLSDDTKQELDEVARMHRAGETEITLRQLANEIRAQCPELTFTWTQLRDHIAEHAGGWTDGEAR